MSRHPVETIYKTKDEVEIKASEILAGIRLPDSECLQVIKLVKIFKL